MEMQDKAKPAIKPVSRRSATIANLAYQYVSIGFMLINGVFVVPLYLKFIDLKIYGAWLATGSVISWLLTVDMGLGDLMRQQAAKTYGSGDMKVAGKVIGTGLIISGVMGLIPTVAGLMISPFIPRLFGIDGTGAEALSLAFLLAAISTSLIIIGGMPGAAQQGLQRNIIYIIIYVMGAISGISCIIVLLLRGYGVLAIPCGCVLQGLIWLVGYWLSLTWICNRMRIRLTFSRKALGKFSSLLAWTSIKHFAHHLLFNCDAFVVGILVGAEATPIYVLSKRVWDLLNFFVNRIGVAFMPGLAHLYGEGEKETFRKISMRLLRTVSWVLAIGAGGCFCFNSSFMSLWVGNKLYAGHLFNGLMAIGIVLQILTFVVNKILYGAENIKGPSIMGTIVYLSKALLLVGMIWTIGFTGGPLSLIISFGLVGGWYFVQQLHKTVGFVSGELKKCFFSLVWSVAVVFIISLLFLLVITVNSWDKFAAMVLVYVVAASGVLLMVDSQFRLQASSLVNWGLRQLSGLRRG